MKKIIVLIFISLMCGFGLGAVFFPSQYVQAQDIPCAMRFQMFSATISNTGGLDHEEFLLDTQTGQTWRYNPLAVPSNGPVEPEVFVPVPIAKATK